MKPRRRPAVLACIQPMTEILSVRVDATVKKRLEALAKHSRRSKSFLAAEAIAAYVQAEERELGEIHKSKATALHKKN